jgi:hypothetical protein
MKLGALTALVLVLTLHVAIVDAADTTAPQLLSLARQAPTTVNVVNPPAAMNVRLEISDDSSGMGWMSVSWVSPSGDQSLVKSDFSERPKKSGFVYLQSPLFTIFHEPGTWTINYVSICDRANNCAFFSGTTLDAIAPPADREYTVVNNRAPDLVGPTADNDGVILTPTVSLSGSAANRKFRVTITMNDPGSGVTFAQACFRPPSAAQAVCAYANPGRPANGTNETLEGEFYTGTVWETGTWTLYYFYMTDIPGNVRTFDTASELNNKFPGGRTIDVTP